MTLETLIPIISVVIAIAGFVLGRISASRSDGKQDGVILTEIGYLKKGNDDIIRKMNEQDHRYNELAEKVVAVDESAKQAHKRITELRDEIKADKQGKERTL
nr:MAG TPA: hypothetical protein [Caudoviricetes sp.]